MVESIAIELAQRSSYLGSRDVGSIYFGGGTPSMLSLKELQHLMDAISGHYAWPAVAEITLEANPDDITAESLKAWRSVGFNRLSIGLQSFNNEELRWMNRAHTAEESLRCVQLAQDAGFSNLSIDLIYGSRFQDMGTWERTLHTAIGLQPTHISAYNLTIEEKTALGHRHRKGVEPAVNDDLSSRQFMLLLDLLEASGYVGYEISNFGKPGFFAQHNTSYWQQQPYLGVGPSAHSFDGQSRQWNVSNNVRYMQAVGSGGVFFEREVLSATDRYNEYILTGLRTMWGCDLEQVGLRFGSVYLDHLKNRVGEMPVEWFDNTAKAVVLSRAGRLQADGIAAALFY